MRRLLRTPNVTLPVPAVLAALALGIAAIAIADRFVGGLAGLAVGVAGPLAYCEVLRRYGRRHREQIRRSPPRLDAATYTCVTVVAAVLLGWFSPLPLFCAAYIWFVAVTDGEERLERVLLRRDGSRGSLRRDPQPP